MLIDFEDVKVEDVSAKLVGEGLLVKLKTDRGNYNLSIKRLYGAAAEVRTLVKSKRLLVRIYKKKNASLDSLDISNLEAWPQPHRKI
jgi:hypothetical protein